MTYMFWIRLNETHFHLIYQAYGVCFWMFWITWNSCSLALLHVCSDVGKHNACAHAHACTHTHTHTKQLSHTHTKQLTHTHTHRERNNQMWNQLVPDFLKKMHFWRRNCINVKKHQEDHGTQKEDVDCIRVHKDVVGNEFKEIYHLSHFGISYKVQNCSGDD